MTRGDAFVRRRAWVEHARLWRRRPPVREQGGFVASAWSGAMTSNRCFSHLVEHGRVVPGETESGVPGLDHLLGRHRVGEPVDPPITTRACSTCSSPLARASRVAGWAWEVAAQPHRPTRRRRGRLSSGGMSHAAEEASRPHRRGGGRRRAPRPRAFSPPAWPPRGPGRFRVWASPSGSIDHRRIRHRVELSSCTRAVAN